MGDKKHLNIPFFDPTKPPPNFNLFFDDGNLLNTPFAPPELKKSFGENVILKSLRRTSDVDNQLLTPKLISPVKAVFTSPIQPPPPPMPNLVPLPKPVTPQNVNPKPSNIKMDQIDKAFINKAIAPLELKQNCTSSTSTTPTTQSLHSAPPYENKSSKNCFFRYKTKQSVKKLSVPSSVPIPSLRQKAFNFGGNKMTFTNKEVPEKSLKPILRDTGNDYKYIQQNKYFDNALSTFQMICLEENKNEAIKTSLKAHHRILEYKECFVIMRLLKDSTSKLYKNIKNGLDKKYLIKELYDIIEERFKKQEFKSVTHPRISIVYNIVKEYEKIIENDDVEGVINDESEVKPFRQGSENIRQFLKEKNPKEVVAFYKKRNEDLDKGDKKYVNIKELIKLLKKRSSCDLYPYKQNDPLIAVIKKVREITKLGIIERLKVQKTLSSNEKDIIISENAEEESVNKQKGRKELLKLKEIVKEKEIQLLSSIISNSEGSDKIIVEHQTNNSNKILLTPYDNFIRIQKIFNDIKYETQFKDANNFKPLYKISEDGGTRMFYVMDRIDKKRCILKEYLNFGDNENLIIQFKSEIECLVKNRERMFEPILGFAINLRLNRLYIGYGINNNTLEKVVKDDNYVPDISFIRLISQQVIEGLYHLERIGIVHKDIKPGNIFVKSDNKQITIGNFHYCSFINEPNNLVYNDKSYNYRALEAYIEPLKLSHAIDMWGAGCVIYEMCTGGFPLFEGNTPLAVVGSIYKVIGAPSRELCHGYDKIPFYRYIHFAKTRPTKLNFSMQCLNPYLEDFFNKIFTHNSSGRIKPYDALFHPYLEDISIEGMKASEKWHMKYEKLKDHSLRFEKQVRYINLLISKLKEQQDRKKEVSEDLSKVMIEKMAQDTEEFLRLKSLNRKRKRLPDLLNILHKKRKVTQNDVQMVLQNMKIPRQLNVEKLIELYKGKDVFSIFVTKPLFRRILIRTGRISVPLAYEILARIEGGKMGLKDVRPGEKMKRKMLSIQASEKLRREKRLLKVKKLNKSKLKRSKKSSSHNKKVDVKKKLSDVRPKVRKLLRPKGHSQCKEKVTLQPFTGVKKTKLRKKPVFATPMLPKHSSGRHPKNSEFAIDKLITNKQKLKKERKMKVKSEGILDFPFEEVSLKKNDDVDKVEKNKEISKLSSSKNSEIKPNKSTKPFPQCLMPDDEPCSSKSIVKAKDKPWYEVKTTPSLPYDKAPKIYIPPDTQITPKRSFTSIQKQLKKISNKSSSHKSQTVKPLKIPPVLTPAERIQKLKAQTPLFSPPNMQQFSKPSPTITHLYNQLSNNKSSPALKSTDLINDSNPFRKDRLDRDTKKQSLTIKDRLFERITTPPKPPNLVFPKSQPSTENEGTIKNLLTVEKDKIQKKIDD